ncbi:Maf family protein [Halalkalibaculum sp. DA3122]|uniref:Maf family protein n=1 Tax=unclassified Halalkalibaculum TaxID=2964617 RepID=UPI003754767E
MNIILASGSPRRKRLLEQLNLDFEVQASNASETYNPDLPPEEIVQNLALRKARQVAGEHRGSDQLVIGADTIVVFGQSILEKPATLREAEQMLRTLSGNTHQVLTGVALVKTSSPGNKQEILTFFQSTDVVFGELDEIEIQQYVQSGLPMDKAGAYGIQDEGGSLFVKRINGDYYNVVGFPLRLFYQKLKKFAPELLHPGLNIPHYD